MTGWEKAAIDGGAGAAQKAWPRCAFSFVIFILIFIFFILFWGGRLQGWRMRVKRLENEWEVAVQKESGKEEEEARSRETCLRTDLEQLRILTAVSMQALSLGKFLFDCLTAFE